MRMASGDRRVGRWSCTGDVRGVCGMEGTSMQIVDSRDYIHFTGYYFVAFIGYI